MFVTQDASLAYILNVLAESSKFQPEFEPEGQWLGQSTVLRMLDPKKLVPGQYGTFKISAKYFASLGGMIATDPKSRRPVKLIAIDVYSGEVYGEISLGTKPRPAKEIVLQKRFVNGDEFEIRREERLTTFGTMESVLPIVYDLDSGRETEVKVQFDPKGVHELSSVSAAFVRTLFEGQVKGSELIQGLLSNLRQIDESAYFEGYKIEKNYLGAYHLLGADGRRVPISYLIVAIDEFEKQSHSK